MSERFQEHVIPGNLTAPKRRWHSAFAKIYCSRALHSLAKIGADKKNNIDPKTLIEIVKQKNLHLLQNFGGTRAVVLALQTVIDGGICGSEEDIAKRQRLFGLNMYKKPPGKSFFNFVVDSFRSFTVVILFISATVSLALGVKLKEGWYDSGSLFVAIFIYITVSALINCRQSKKIDNLLSKVCDSIQIDVVRSCRGQQIPISKIVVGDVICLKIGDQVPADGLFLCGHSLKMDESTVTGYGDSVEISSEQNPFVFACSKVVDGYARMVVTSVGVSTIWDQIMSQITCRTSEQTLLQARVRKLTSLVDVVGLLVASSVLVLLLARYLTGHTKNGDGTVQFIRGKTRLDEVINAVVNLIIPDGLPLAVTVTLAFSMKSMMADQAMVRKLSACETMGSATVICTDKTGTLTLNHMKVKKIWLGQEPVRECADSSVSPKVIELIQHGVALNTTSSVYRATSGSELEFSGSSIERAILSWAILEMNMDMEEMEQSCIILKLEAFNSQKKRSGVMMRKKTDNKIHVHWKGAAEIILAMCSSYYDASGNMKHLDDGGKEKVEQIIQCMAASSLQCIAFAHKQVQEEDSEDANKKRINEDDLILLGVIGIKDQCCPGVKKAVEDCQHGGVNVKMLTGDNIFTARAIATECGILRPDQDMSTRAVIDGEEFRNYTPEERMEKVDKICVMARSSPSDKLLMVQCLKQKGHVVAITGNSANDAMALKEANIGLSMGMQGTQVAKENSDIIIMDDNFATVVTVLRWGRCVRTNIKKFIQFKLTIIVTTLLFNFLAAVSAGKNPLTPVQLLWVNLIVDALGALALVTEPPTNELMDKPPACCTEPLITNVMCMNIFAQACYQISILLTLLFKGELIFGVDENARDTLIFNIFVLCQVFNEFNARKLERKNVFEGIHKNKLFMGIIGITIALQVVMLEFLKRFADTKRLNWAQWGACIGIAAVSLPICWALKCLPVPEKTFFKLA